ncbi:unnamed protein product [Clonostachys rosea f. rosea IK726]|uniref:Uncharacterized protein n=1 Tax=Clonostachys rosea f. rosea IK726 TaxID=1349383 RepID=A0ACA9TYQ8_BIOOC|nr:unnamed protein product [Clonostachys rosea f. rosea IK726]
MWQLLGFVRKRSDLTDAIKEDIVIAAEGILYFDSLKDKTSATEIKTSLEKFRKRSQTKEDPNNKLYLLAQAYDEAMDRIHMQQPGFQQLAARVLSWIIFARRQLTILELQHALAVSVGDKRLDEDNIRDIKDVVSVCLGLVTVDEQSGIVRLVHYNTQEYFEQTKTRLFPNAEAELATICVAYISFSIFESGLCETDSELQYRMRSRPLYDYTAQNWGHHARSATTPISGVWQFLSNRALINASNQTFCGNVLSQHQRYNQILTRGPTAIHLAAYFGLTPEVTSMLEQKVEVDSLDGHDRTPLTYASMNGHEATVKFLLEKGAKAHAPDMYPGTPLSYAVECGQEVIVKLLLSHGVAANSRAHGSTRFPFKGAQLRHYTRLKMTPLCVAALHGHEAISKLLIEKGADLEHRDLVKMTPLCIAVEENHEAVVDMLLIKGAEFESAPVHAYIPLSWAARHGYESIFNLLLKKSAHFEPENNEGGGTALTCATGARQLIITKHLLSITNVNVDWKDNSGRTPLSRAASGGHVAIIELLLDRGAKIESESNTRRTLLSFAAEEGHQDIVEFLLKRGGVNANSRDIFGRTPLHWALRYGHDQVVMNLILNEGSDPNSMDIYGSTPISVAARHDQAHLMKQLLDTGGINVVSQDCFRRTPLWYARRYGNPEVQQLLLEHIEEGRGFTLDSEDDSAVQRYEGSKPTGPTNKTCDICTMGIEFSGACYCCRICNNGNLNICLDCYQAGGHCLGRSLSLIEW